MVFETVKRINHSLIGWYLQNYGMQNALDIIQWMGVNLFTASENYKWSLRKPLLKEDNEETRRQLDQMLDGYDDLEEKIKYRFQNKAYLLQAVSDKSFTSNDLTADYKGLDFAGDAVLNYVTVRHLFRQPQYLSADDLKNVAILLYCNSSLATVSARNEMHKYLRYTTPEIRNNINSFVSFLRRNKFRPVDDVILQWILHSLTLFNLSIVYISTCLLFSAVFPRQKKFRFRSTANHPKQFWSSNRRDLSWFEHGLECSVKCESSFQPSIYGFFH